MPAAPRFSLLPAILLLLGAITLCEGLRMVRGPKKCCFAKDFANGPPKKEVVSYMKTSQRCTNRALLLTTTAGRRLCARPSDAWVQNIVLLLDSKKTLGNQSPLQ